MFDQSLTFMCLGKQARAAPEEAPRKTEQPQQPVVQHKHASDPSSNAQYSKSQDLVNDYDDDEYSRSKSKKHYDDERLAKLIAEENASKSKFPRYPGLERWELVDKMGDGAFSNVYRARDTTGEQGEVAIKVVRKYEMNSMQVSIPRVVCICRPFSLCFDAFCAFLMILLSLSFGPHLPTRGCPLIGK